MGKNGVDAAGLNNNIRVIQRRCYGMRDENYLHLKILTCTLPPPPPKLSKPVQSPARNPEEPEYRSLTAEDAGYAGGGIASRLWRSTARTHDTFDEVSLLSVLCALRAPCGK